MSNIPFRSTKDLKEDVLIRASEPINGSSQFETRVVNYLNRVNRTLCTCASEFLPEYVDRWWWNRERGVIYAWPIINQGSVEVTQASPTVKFTLPLAPALDSFILDKDALVDESTLLDLTGWRLRVADWPDVFVIQDYDPATGIGTLDMPYTGTTDPASSFKLLKNTYTLNTGVDAIISPMVSFRNQTIISGMSPESMDFRWPLSALQEGVPQAFALENELTIRFSHAGRLDSYMRFEFYYRPSAATLINSDQSIPKVPLQYRHLLADMALVYVLLDKNDDRASAANAAARSGLAAMIKENRRRLSDVDKNIGRLLQTNRRGPIRTESGLVFDYGF